MSEENAKVVGEIGDEDAVGVVGRATGAGDSHGVKGEASSGEGYGIYTPDDARVDGMLAVAALTGTLTGDEELTDLAGDNLTISNGALHASGDSGGNGDSNWTDAGDGLLEPAAGFRGVDLSGDEGGTVVTPRVESGDELVVETDEWRVETEIEGSEDGDAGNVVVGYPENVVDEDAVGATIAGGGAGDFRHNIVYDDYGTIGGGSGNRVGVDDDDPDSSPYATVAGGDDNVANGSRAAVGGGTSNEASGTTAVVAGGSGNEASSSRAFVGSGTGNEASGSMSVIGGGWNNEATGVRAVVLGGKDNVSDSWYTTIGGGEDNTVTGSRATIPGGELNTADGDHSFAAGYRAHTNGNDGTFVWGDDSGHSVEADADDQVVFQAGGGMKVYTESDTDEDTGAELPAGSGSWTSLSASAAKSNVSAVDPQQVLDGVEDLDVATWEYNSQEGVSHMGPMAEQFHDAFELGGDEERIATVDADGVALAAIQGLSEKLDEKDDRIDAQDERIETLEAENEQLRERLAAIEDRLD